MSFRRQKALPDPSGLAQVVGLNLWQEIFLRKVEATTRPYEVKSYRKFHLEKYRTSRLISSFSLNSNRLPFRFLPLF